MNINTLMKQHQSNLLKAFMKKLSIYPHYLIQLIIVVEYKVILQHMVQIMIRITILIPI